MNSTNILNRISTKRIILLELCVLFLASAFPSDKNPGWVQQSVPVNKTINDIFFIDSLRGWAVTTWAPQYDTSYILSTTNGGTNWNMQYQGHFSLTAIQFLDSNIGYSVGGYGYDLMLKTTNGGNNWNIIISGIGQYFNDLFFVNKDTGWVCDPDLSFGVGVIKTTNGGLNWFQQLDMSYKPTKLFFINRDTGWCACNDTKLYRTTNSGANWNLQFTSQYTIESLFFLNKEKGWMRGGYISGTMGVAYSTDGGFTWTNAQGTVGGMDIHFVNDSVGYSGGGYQKITKSINGGKQWGYQISPINSNIQISTIKNDTLDAWAGTSGIVHTTDGGGPIIFTGISNNIQSISNNYELYQNYPNPFNPVTSIRYKVESKKQIRLIVYDIQGREIATLVNEKKKAGEYEVRFEGSKLSSGIYFYSLFVDGVRVDTKKMALLK